jgi:hypothetical protein
VPHTAGVAALLLDYAETTTEADDSKSEVIKAVMVNSTFPNIRNKSGQLTYPALPANVWDTDRGYGRLDALRALKTLRSRRITPGETTTDPNGWAYDSVASGQQDSYTIAGIKNQRLVITLTWNRKVVWTDKKRGFPPKYNGIIDDDELEVFFADLDLEIYEPNNPDPLVPKISSKDNLEKVDRLLTKTGNYQIKVVNKSASESAAYAMAFELLEPMQADFNIDYIVDTADLSAMLSWWLEPGCDSIGDCLSVDLTGDGMIDLGDTAVLGGQWLMKDPRYWPVQ